MAEGLSDAERLWIEHYEKVQEYRAERRAFPGKTTRYKGYRIGKWLVKQKKTLEFPNHNIIDTRRRVLLSSLPGWNWEWRSPYKVWQDQLLALRDYLSTHENRFPEKEDNSELYKWVNDQKKRKNLLRPERQRQLSEITGWIWDPSATRIWESNYTALQNYLRFHGVESITLETKFNGVKLGYWVYLQAKWIKSSSYERDKKIKLAQLGLTFG